MKIEIRDHSEVLQVETRKTDSGATVHVIEGYAARYEVWSRDLGGWKERIKRGAFKAALAKDPDVRALVNHDPNKVLGRSSSGTLTLSEDSRGLKYRVEAPDTTFARDLLVSMRRGDVRESSFAFRVGPGGAAWNDDLTERTITEVAELFDVSPVTIPAYPDATAGVVRSVGIWTEVAVSERDAAAAAKQREINERVNNRLKGRGII